jgi:hypothetical protein
VARTFRLWTIVAMSAGFGCSRAPGPATSSTPAPPPLAAMSAQRLIIAPTAGARGDTVLRWSEQLGGSASAALRLDTNIAQAFAARGVTSQWIWPADLVRSYDRNRTYGVNPYRLAVTAVSAPGFKAGDKYAEPLSSQLRTMIAMHDDARLVLVPIELRFEREGAAGGVGRALLRTTILDPRFAEARWVSEVRGDPASAPALALASLASRLADLFVAP